MSATTTARSRCMPAARRSSLQGRVVQGSSLSQEPTRAGVIAVPDAADRRVLSVVGRSGRGLQQGRRARCRGGTVLLPGSHLHDARRDRHFACPGAEHQLRAHDDRLRLRLYRRRLDRRARGRVAADAPLCEPERRESPLGQIPGAAADHERGRADARHRRRRQTGDRLRHGRRRRHAGVRMARPGESHCAVADAYDFGAAGRRTAMASVPAM